jgi:hypothetical protein
MQMHPVVWFHTSLKPTRVQFFETKILVPILKIKPGIGLVVGRTQLKSAIKCQLTPS